MQTRHALFLFLIAAAGLAAACTWAQSTAGDLAAYRKLPVCSLSADGTRLAVEPCRTAPPKNPMPRRAVTEIITPMPRVALARPVVAPALPAMRVPSASERPVPLIACSAGSCLDANGLRHSIDSSNATVTPSGKLCNVNGNWLQCF